MQAMPGADGAFPTPSSLVQGFTASGVAGPAIDLASPDPSAVREALRARWPDLAAGLGPDGPAWLGPRPQEREILAGPDAVPARQLADRIRGDRPLHGPRMDLVVRVEEAVSVAERRGFARLSEDLNARILLLSRELDTWGCTCFVPSASAVQLRARLCDPRIPAEPVTRVALALDRLRYGEAQEAGAKRDLYRREIRPLLADILARARGADAEAQAVLDELYPELVAAQDSGEAPRSPLESMFQRAGLSREQTWRFIEESLAAGDADLLRGERLLPRIHWVEGDPIVEEALERACAAMEAERARWVADLGPAYRGEPALIEPASRDLCRAALDGSLAASWVGFGLGNLVRAATHVPVGIAAYLLAGLAIHLAGDAARRAAGLDRLPTWSVLSLGTEDIRANLDAWGLQSLPAGVDRAQRESIAVLTRFAALAARRHGVAMTVVCSHRVAHEPIYRLLHERLVSPTGPFAHLPAAERAYLGVQISEQIAHLGALGAFDRRLAKLAWHWLPAFGLQPATELRFNNATRDAVGEDALIDVLTRADVTPEGGPAAPYFHTGGTDRRLRLVDDAATMRAGLQLDRPEGTAARNLPHMVQTVRLWEAMMGPLTPHVWPDGYEEIVTRGTEQIRWRMPADALVAKLQAMGAVLLGGRTDGSRVSGIDLRGRHWRSEMTALDGPDAIHADGLGVATAYKRAGHLARILPAWAGIRTMPFSTYASRRLALEMTLTRPPLPADPAGPSAADRRQARRELRALRSNGLCYVEVDSPRAGRVEVFLRAFPLGARSVGDGIPGGTNARLARWAEVHGMAVPPIRMLARDALHRLEVNRDEPLVAVREDAIEVWLPDRRSEMYARVRGQVSEGMKALPPRPEHAVPVVPGLSAQAQARWAAQAEAWADALRAQHEARGRAAFEDAPPPPRPPGIDDAGYASLTELMQRWALYRVDPRAGVAAWKAVALPAIETIALTQADLDGTIRRVGHPSFEEAVTLAVAQAIHPDTVALATALGVKEGLEAYAGWLAVGGWIRARPAQSDVWHILESRPLEWPFATAVALRQAETETWPVTVQPHLALARPGVLHPNGILVERVARQLGEERFQALLTGSPTARRAFEACARDVLARFDAEPERFFEGHRCVRVA